MPTPRPSAGTCGGWRGCSVFWAAENRRAQSPAKANVRKRHHVVSEGYLRFFADGGRILLCTKATRSAKVVGTRDTFVTKHFNTVVTERGRLDKLEDQWQALENECLPRVRTLLLGERGEEQQWAARVLAALHFARSYGFQQAWDRIFRGYLAKAPIEAAEAPVLRQAFRDEYGRAPLPGEIEEYVSVRLREIREARELFVERMANAHNWALDKFAPMEVQIIEARARGVAFITGDTPLIHFDDGIKLGLAGGLALGEAAHVYMPLGTRLGMMLTTNPEPDLCAPPWVIQKLNWLVWRAAHSQVVCHPAVDLNRALATRGITNLA